MILVTHTVGFKALKRLRTALVAIPHVVVIKYNTIYYNATAMFPAEFES